MEAENVVRAPRNTWEVFWWIFFDHELLKNYSRSLNTVKKRWNAIRKPFSVLFALTFAILILGYIVEIFLLKTHLNPEWNTNYEIILTLFLLLFPSVLCLLGFFNFGIKLGVGIVIFLMFLFPLFFIYPHPNHKLNQDPVIVIYTSFIWGFIWGIFRWRFAYLIGLLYLFIGIYDPSSNGISISMTFLTFWTLFYYRIPFYVYYLIKALPERYSLAYNPYQWDGTIQFPIINLEKHLENEVLENPEEADGFIHFLLEYRKYQRPLAHHLLHAQTAGYWRKNRLQPEILKTFIEVPDDEDKKFRPSQVWYEKLHAMRHARMDSARENNIYTHLQYFDAFRQKLADFRQQNLLESPVWNHYYFDTLDLWVKSADSELERLKLEAQNQEPVCPNIYRGGEQLDPKFDKDLFFGREDLRHTFETKVVTAASMPLFFIQGQRRVGKSSLIRFLPEYLDSGFVLVYLDLQTGIASVPEWLELMRRAIWKNVRKKDEPPALPSGGQWEKGNWLQCWRLFQEELETIAREDGRRIILALDEYEELHRCLQTDPEQGGQLLGAMRSFSQSQNRVVFLFAGADFFTELKNPNWNEYFVQAVPLTVGYLSREDTFRLIQVVPLRYPEELLERMYLETQGHPCLLQKICQEMVNIANASGKKDMVPEDYDSAVQRVVMQPHNGVVDVFWGQFCALRGMKGIVHEILDGKPPSDERLLKVMKIHGFVVEDNGTWRLRVSLFDRWVREFGDL